MKGGYKGGNIYTYIYIYVFSLAYKDPLILEQGQWKADTHTYIYRLDSAVSKAKHQLSSSLELVGAGCAYGCPVSDVSET